jgi:tetratricopeptide (TPR) repeat protein
MFQNNKLLFAIFIICLLQAIFLNTNFAFSIGFTDKQQKEAANTALKEALDLGYPNKSLILSMLSKKEYSELETYFANLEIKYMNETSYESLLLKSYQNFDSQFDAFLPHLNEWVKNRGTHIAFCARGFYFANEGFKIRGTKYIKDTPKNNLIKMHEFHEKAKIDLEKSIEINPDFMPAYEQLIRISMAAGDNVYKKAIYQEAIKHDKRTYYVRYAYLLSLEPRWGGTYSQMQSVINESINFAHLNPRIWSLKGAIDFEKAYVLILEKKYHAAIDFLNKAISYGDRTEWLNERADCYAETKQYKMELEDRERYLFYKPNDAKTINRVAKLRKIFTKSN